MPVQHDIPELGTYRVPEPEVAREPFPCLRQVRWRALIESDETGLSQRYSNDRAVVAQSVGRRSVGLIAQKQDFHTMAHHSPARVSGSDCGSAHSQSPPDRNLRQCYRNHLLDWRLRTRRCVLCSRVRPRSAASSISSVHAHMLRVVLTTAGSKQSRYGDRYVSLGASQLGTQ